MFFLHFELSLVTVVLTDERQLIFFKKKNNKTFLFTGLDGFKITKAKRSRIIERERRRSRTQLTLFRCCLEFMEKLNIKY